MPTSTPNGGGLPAESASRRVAPNFITDIVDADLERGRVGEVVTRFPPEPNGYAHIGHAFASALNFGVAADYGGACRLRFDDTNPETEKLEYASAIEADMGWLGWDWGGEARYASDYFPQLYAYAVRLIEMGLAYVESLPEEEMATYRGTVEEPGRPSPYRERTVEENLDLFERMRFGEFPNGAHVLRAKIDLANPNMKLRDPVLYRIVHAPHYRTGDTWRVYPSYDFAQALTDALDGVTHSLCSLEFVDNRAIYDWLLEHLWEGQRPYQHEFGRRSLEYTVVSKRKLIELVRSGAVSGWDDPRMPTISGLRRRGVTPEAIRRFAGNVGVSRTNRTVELALLEHSIREDLNAKAPRVMAVLRPLRVIITNYPEGEGETLEAPSWPHDVPREGSRPVPFSRELAIEREDFAEVPPKGFHRLTPGGRVRLRHAYVITCREVVKGEDGEVLELRCTYDPDTLGRAPAEGLAVKGTIHWVSIPHAAEVEVRLYDRLFSVPNPDEGEAPFTDYLNPDSLFVLEGALLEPSVAAASEGHYQFERQGYFAPDPDSRPDRLVFNRVVALRDSWAKEARAEPVARAERRVEAPVARPAGTTAGLSPEALAVFERLTSELGIGPAEARVLATRPELARLLEEARAFHHNAPVLASWLVNELSETDAARLGPARLASLVGLVDDGTLSNRLAKEVLAEALATGADPREVVERGGLRQVSDEAALEPVVARVVAENPDKASAYRGGRTGLLGFFVGQVMKETGGRANPQLVGNLVTRRLES